MDQKSIDKLNLLHPKIRQIAIAAYTEAVRITAIGVHPVIDQTLRSFEESDRLYQQGRTTSGEIVTNAKAGQSFHNYGLALDFHIQLYGKDSWVVGENWLDIVRVFKSHGFIWGGNFKSIKDYPHFEMNCGYTWKQLLAIYNAKKFIPGTQYVQI